MQNDILPNVIFSPGELALGLADSLVDLGVEVTLFSAGSVTTKAKNVTADLSFFQEELVRRGDTYLDLLKKHPLTFITLARQAQAALVAQAYELANKDQFDLIHIYTNEEDIALPFAQFCKKPVVFTHHDPFNFLVGYRNTFPKYKHLNWLAISNNQRLGMPEDTNWVGTIELGLNETDWPKQSHAKEDYLAYIGRIIEPKGVELAIEAVQLYNQTAKTPLKLKIAGKHYASSAKNSYWEKVIKPKLADSNIEYVGFISSRLAKQAFLSKAQALLIPSLFAEPFGLVMPEALACGTPLIGLDSGAIPDVIEEGVTGFVIKKQFNNRVAEHREPNLSHETIEAMAAAIGRIAKLTPEDCRRAFINRFTMKRMATKHLEAYQKLVTEQPAAL